MPDDKQQTESTEQEGEQTETTMESTTEGEVEESGTDKLLKALKAEREARQAAERKLKETDKDKRKAETERAIKAGEIETVVASHAAEVADLNARIAELEGQITERDTAIIRAKVAAKHRIPALLVDRIRGANEQEMDADAKELAKTVAAPTAPETEAGRGNNRGGLTPEQRRQKIEQDQNREIQYTPF
jgi:hypothetical protein